jgi:uncharacterized protein (TIGR02145 family)
MRNLIAVVVICLITIVMPIKTLKAQSITLTFTGQDPANRHIELWYVHIENLTQNWEEFLDYPDTTLMLGNTGIDDLGENNNSLLLSQNVPNPFDGTTDLLLQMPRTGHVLLEVFELNGKKVVDFQGQLSAGKHTFRVSLNTAQSYLLTARSGNDVATIKMVNNGSSGENSIRSLEDSDTFPLTMQLKGGTKGISDKPFAVGDNMKYYGTAIINGAICNTDIINKVLSSSEKIVLKFKEMADLRIPTVTTDKVRDISFTEAICDGNVISDGGATVTDRGFVYSTNHNPTLGIGNNHVSLTLGQVPGKYSARLTGLTVGTTYYVRAYATNKVGTAYGNEISFTTSAQDGLPCPGVATVTDIDGNTYNTVQIGAQCWMKENLKTTKYADGVSILQGTPTNSNRRWCYPNNNSSTKDRYGLLYDRGAMMGSSSSTDYEIQGVCPKGWHIPSEKEWKQLIDYVSSQNQYVCNSDNTYIAKALASTMGWASNTKTCTVGNTQSNNNSTGFSAFPAGYCHGDEYVEYGRQTGFWCAKDSYEFRINYDYPAIYSQHYNSYPISLSVRCIH